MAVPPVCGSDFDEEVPGQFCVQSCSRAAVHVQMENNRPISGQAGTGQCGSDTVSKEGMLVRRNGLGGANKA